jgi:UDP:flavonoid glycosyltransferase YjiC (YdhE family)
VAWLALRPPTGRRWNARYVAAAGAGVVVEPGLGAAVADRIGPQDTAQLRAAIEAVLDDPSYRQAAQRIASEIRQMPTIDEVLSALP